MELNLLRARADDTLRDQDKKSGSRAGIAQSSSGDGFGNSFGIAPLLAQPMKP